MCVYAEILISERKETYASKRFHTNHNFLLILFAFFPLWRFLYVPGGRRQLLIINAHRRTSEKRLLGR